MTDACPACGFECDFGVVCREGACPDCGTDLAELHAVAIDDGGGD
jgi:hypothetical protein